MNGHYEQRLNQRPARYVKVHTGIVKEGQKLIDVNIASYSL
jgi:hypothetical protein